MSRFCPLLASQDIPRCDGPDCAFWGTYAAVQVADGGFKLRYVPAVGCTFGRQVLAEDDA